ncbi:MAG: hypothetical protein J6W52_11670 [Bacteroidaceae bacterium]|nr:hypothetical protein [Bacteroidaceae bacterium]
MKIKPTLTTLLLTMTTGHWVHRSWRVLFLLAIFNCQLSIVNSVKAQQENAAFYIYQNDGHFDGFFYDEVLKMSYSKTDTAGVEYDVFVTQEIVTADSTYRIMLSAIDSVGFVQPEVKYNPRVYIKGIQDPYFYWEFVSSIYQNEVDVYAIEFRKDIDEGYIYDPQTDEFIKRPLPKVGDVFVDFGTDYDLNSGWSGKIISLTRDYEGCEGHLVAICKPLEDITDIFRQYVCVEEYDHDRQGNLVRRRVAGRPDLNVGYFPKRASGKFSGDVFRFGLNGHIPLYDQDDLSVSIDPSLEGKVNVKVDWNIPFIGTKYVGITTRLDLGMQLGITVDGKLTETKKGGYCDFATIPLPATTPILVLDLGPDMFIRGQADLKFSVASPKAEGSIWCKVEIKDWWPSFSCGKGKSGPGEEESSASGAQNSSAKLELSGWLQAGCNFPMKIASLPVLKKIFNASIGGEWFIGPKVSGSVSLDVGSLIDNLDNGDNDYYRNCATLYNLLKDTKLSMSLCDADFEISADVQSAFSPRKKWTMADGTMSIFPAFEAGLAPEFVDYTEYTEHRLLGDSMMMCQILAFRPSGNVFKSVPIGTYNNTVDISINDIQLRPRNYSTLDNLIDLPKSEWAECIIPYNKGRVSCANGKFKVRPFVGFMNRFIPVPDVRTFVHGAFMELANNDIEYDYDGSTINKPCIILDTNCTELKPTPKRCYPGILIEQVEWKDYEPPRLSGNQVVCTAWKNLSPIDTIKVQWGFVGINYIHEEMGITEPMYINLSILPNPVDCPAKTRLSIGFLNYSYLGTRYRDAKVTRNGDIFHVSVNESSVNLSFDLVPRTDKTWVVTNGNFSLKDYGSNVDSSKYSYEDVARISDNEFSDNVPKNIEWRYGDPGFNFSFPVHGSVYDENGKFLQSFTDNVTLNVFMYFQEYINEHPDEFE